jgi:phytoene dehydrogenase-like protein
MEMTKRVPAAALNSRSQYSAIIIGAGHNGLVCAAYLARAGLKVLVLEARPFVGGACVTEEVFPGYHVSTCAYLVHVLQDKVVRDLDLYRHGYQVLSRDPGFVLPFGEGKAIRMWVDPKRTAREFEQFSAQDAAGFLRWENFWREASGLLAEDLLREPPTLDQLRERVRGTDREALLERLIAGTLRELLDECFTTDEAKAAVIHIPFVMRPLDEPGVLLAEASLQIDRHADPQHQGLPVGGMSTLSNAMARAAESFGAVIRTDSKVEEITVTSGRAAGVRLESGEHVESGVVVSNCDPKRTFLDLLDPAGVTDGIRYRVESMDTECGTIKFIGALRELPDVSRYLGPGHDPAWLSGVRFCPSVAYFEEALKAALDGELPDRPLLSIQIPTVYDPSVAPPGRHLCTMWVRYYPTHPRAGSWDELRQQAEERIIEETTRWIPGFRDLLLERCIYTPLDLERRMGLTDGNIHHLHHAGTQVLAGRAGYRTTVEGLYLCGAGTHPGGEVSGAPGHNAAHVILGDRTS